MARPIATLAGLAGLLAIASCAEQGDDAVQFCQRAVGFNLSDGDILSSRTKAKALCSPMAAYRVGAQAVSYVRHILRPPR